ncbi:MAG: RagB/SusD family nutrient uptake outer membrane protein [Bacteroidota bacterium]
MKKINIKIKTISKTLALAMLLFVCSSCEDFLNEVNPNQISTAIFWKNASDLEIGVNAIYNAFKNRNVLEVIQENNRSDLTYPGFGRPNPSENNLKYWAHLYTPADPGPQNKWNSLYEGIFRANQVIEAYERIAPTLDENSQALALESLAQARFFRGLFHFYLSTSFNNGEVIIRDNVPTTIDEINNKSLSPASDVKAFYRDDLTFASENLPVTWSQSSDLGRVTAGSAIAVLGKSYLYDGEYETAEQFFRRIVDEFDYTLVDDIGDNFSTATEFNSESILEISYSTTFKTGENPNAEEVLSTNLNRAFAPGGQAQGFRTLYPACWLIMEYKRDTPDPLDTLGTLSNKVLARDNDGVPILKPDGSDSTRIRRYSIRTSRSIALVDDLQESYYQGRPAEVAGFNNGETAYWKKYTNAATLTSEGDNPTVDRSALNIVVIRLADIYLMLAECLIRGGTNEAGVEEALVYVNRVRRRAKVVLLGPVGTGEFPTFTQDGVSYTAQSLMNHLMFVERPVELSAEGHAIRFIDLRRWGITKQRYEDLAPTLYAADNFVFTNPQTGNSATKFGSVLIEVATEAEAEANFLNSRTLPALNYSDDLHAYWALPEGELANNEGINTDGQ